MKIEYGEFGGFEFIAEDGKDVVWLKELIENADDKDGEFLVDLESCNVLEDGHPATDIDFKTARGDDGYVWGTVERIKYDPFGF